MIHAVVENPAVGVNIDGSPMAIFELFKGQ